MEASPSPPPAPAAKRIGVGDVISQVFSVYGENAGALLGSALAVFVVVGLVSGILTSSGGLILVLLGIAVSMAGNALYTGFVVELVKDVRDGRRDHTVGDLFSAAMPFVLPLIGFGILFGFAVAFGFLLLFVPGLILLTFWSVGAPAIVIENEGPFGAFGRSWNLVRGNAWPVFGVILAAFVIVIVIQGILAAIASPIGDGDASTWIASIISSTLAAPIYALAAAVLYYELVGDGSADAAAAQAPPPPSPPPSA